MALRGISPPAPRLRGRPSVRLPPARWQVAQAMVLLPDSRGSKNSSLPSATFSRVGGLPTGVGAGPSTAEASAGAPPFVFQAAATTVTDTARGMTTSHGQRGRMGFLLSELAPFENAGESSGPSSI